MIIVTPYLTEEGIRWECCRGQRFAMCGFTSADFALQYAYARDGEGPATIHGSAPLEEKPASVDWRPPWA